jgi:hypothetical protein
VRRRNFPDNFLSEMVVSAYRDRHPMRRPLELHLKAALICALVAIVLTLPLLWALQLPAWPGWSPELVSPRAEALLSVLLALWTAWCVVDIPRRGLKVLIWIATFWLLASGLWIAGLYGFTSNPLAPLVAVGLAGAGALAFSFSPAGSRRARWEALVGNRVAPEFLRNSIDERHMDDGPRSEILAVVEVLWPGSPIDEHQAWSSLAERAERAAEHFLNAGGYLERCDGEGVRFVFGCWGGEISPAAVVEAVSEWVKVAGGCAAITRGECVTGVGNFPTGARWTVGGLPLRRVARMAAAARGYAARVVVEDTLAKEVGKEWAARRLAWWDFEGERILLSEIVGKSEEASSDSGEVLRRWDRAWDAFWSGDWSTAENVFGSLAREREDDAARIFAMRSEAARRQDSAK